MKNEITNGKEGKITNDDSSVTNKDEDLDKGEQPANQTQPDAERVPTVTPDNDSGKPGAPAVDEDPSNKDAGPSGEIYN